MCWLWLTLLTNVPGWRALSWIWSLSTDRSFQTALQLSNTLHPREVSLPNASIVPYGFSFKVVGCGCFQWFFFIFTLFEDFGMFREAAAVLMFSDVSSSEKLSPAKDLSWWGINSSFICRRKRSAYKGCSAASQTLTWAILNGDLLGCSGYLHVSIQKKQANANECSWKQQWKAIFGCFFFFTCPKKTLL